MMVRSGWNSEYARKKFDVELGEDDLLRIILATGLPAEAMGLVTTPLAFTILHASAEIIARQTLAEFDPSIVQRMRTEAESLKARRDKALAQLAERWQDSHHHDPKSPESQEQQVG